MRFNGNIFRSEWVKLCKTESRYGQSHFLHIGWYSPKTFPRKRVVFGKRVCLSIYSLGVEYVVPSLKTRVANHGVQVNERF